MVKLLHSEMRVLDEVLDMSSGYVLDFSDRTMAEFFDDEFGITIYQEKYAFNGTSKAKHVRAFVMIKEPFLVAQVLRGLWNYRESIERYRVAPNAGIVKDRFFQMLTKIEGNGAVPRTDALYRFKRDETLDELVSAISRDISANKPGPALDRLHTYCMKKFSYLLEQRPGGTCDRSDPLHSRVGKYLKLIAQERQLRDMTYQIVRNAIGVFEKFNHIRNNDSLAHDNDLVDAAEARFIYDSVTAVLRFVKTIEADRFEPG